MPAKTASLADFDASVLSASVPVLVDFWAEWCGPCKAMAPDLDAVADEVEGRALVVKVNADENPDLATRYGVRGLPTLLMFKDGEVVDMRAGGALPRSKIKDMIASAL